MQAGRLSALQGVSWLLAGLALFRRNPALLTGLTLAYVFLIVAINLIPLAGPFFLPLALPTLVLVVANGCRVVDLNRPPEDKALLRGLREHRVALVQLGGLHLLGSLLVLAVSMAVEGGQSPLMSEGPVDQAEVAAALLRLLLIAIPAIMAFWFAPLLTGWDGVPALKSVFFSFVAAWRNWRAFLAYALAVALLAIALPGLLLIAAEAVSQSLAQGLSFVLRLAMILVVAPVLTASVYVSYRQVFHSHDR